MTPWKESETIDETYDIPALEPLDTDVQRVLIEDFTGHQCATAPTPTWC